MSFEAREEDDAVQAKSRHTSDEFLRPFLKSSFDPASFLNARLEKGAPLARLSNQAQALVSQLDGQTTRMTDTLTQLTDDILRSGSRLAYEVELLRGETVGLEESLHETLQDDVRQFVPGGLRRDAAGQETTSGGGDSGEEAQDPDCIKQLQTLTLVREQLESVIKIFGAAMEFSFPPSEVSVGSSFLSVSAPEPGSEQQSSEEKGQQALRRLRDEISELLGSNSGGGDDNDDDLGSAVQGVEKAATRVAELKELASVWKGTAEEKGRNRFIDSLAKMVEDRHRELMLASGKREGKAEAEARAQPGGFGLMSQLQKLRSGL
ncbi:hypothetical protein CP533_3185 [Ophiocordyceps camponoti-saundersi (nom. inval.)]|nr:hypothetical protein CP533_3185 [Ophiocordyceps camponoti-saundersi (nom. inval.)]